MGDPGCCAINALNLSGGQESAKEQPAIKSGSNTLREGFSILAVSAIKKTPATSKISAFEAAAN